MNDHSDGIAHGGVGACVEDVTVPDAVDERRWGEDACEEVSLVDFEDEETTVLVDPFWDVLGFWGLNGEEFEGA